MSCFTTRFRRQQHTPPPKRKKQATIFAAIRNMGDDSSNDSSDNNTDHTIREAFDRTLVCSTPTKSRRAQVDDPPPVDLDADIVVEKDSATTTLDKRSASSSSGVSSLTERSSSSSSAFIGVPVHLIRVRVEDRLLSIPLPKDFSSLTIAYLEQQAADRYQAIEGTRPVVNIALEDGALLCSSDPILCVQGIPVLKGVVVSWNVPPLEERFKTKVGERQADKRTAVRCQIASALGKLELDHMRVPQELMVVLKHEVHLHTLHLSYTHIDPNALLALGEALTKLKNLKVLRLVGCNLRGKQLCDMLGKFGSTDLEEMDLSYNYIDHFFTNVVTSSTLPKTLTALHKVRLTSCGIHGAELIEGLKQFPLTSLDISCNPLGAAGFDAAVSLLQSNSRLQELDISNCLSECTGQYFASILEKCQHAKVLKVNGLIHSSPILPHLESAACNPSLRLHAKGNPRIDEATLAGLENAFRQVIIS